MQVSFLTDSNIHFLIGIGLSAAAGILIGLEREARGKDAGISTNVFVIVGSMLFTYFSMTVDPNSTSRISAQVVSGIGFLGVGMILKDGLNVRNLTTAASLWFSAAIGMAFGYHYYLEGALASFLAVAIPRIPHVHSKQNHNGNGNGHNGTISSDSANHSKEFR